MPELKELIQKYLPQVLEHRHHIHQHPELTGQEKETAAYIAETLRSMGLKPVEGVGGYGVVALIEGRGPGKCVGLRADIDAPPLTECTGLLPAQMEGDGEIGALSELMQLPVKPPEEDR